MILKTCFKGARMFRKTDKYFRRKVRVWGCGYVASEEVVELVRRETWWIFFIPVLSIDTIIDKQ